MLNYTYLEDMRRCYNKRQNKLCSAHKVRPAICDSLEDLEHNLDASRALTKLAATNNKEACELYGKLGGCLDYYVDDVITRVRFLIPEVQLPSIQEYII